MVRQKVTRLGSQERIGKNKRKSQLVQQQNDFRNLSSVDVESLNLNESQQSSNKYLLIGIIIFNILVIAGAASLAIHNVDASRQKGVLQKQKQKQSCKKILNELNLECKAKLDQQNRTCEKIIKSEEVNFNAEQLVRQEQQNCNKRVNQYIQKRNQIMNDLNRQLNPGRIRQNPKAVFKKQTGSLKMPSQQQLQGLQANKELIIVTKASNQVYIKKIFQKISKQKGYFSEWHLWITKAQLQTNQFILQLIKANSWIKMITNIYETNPSISYMNFYTKDCQQKKLYLFISQNIMWIQDMFIEIMYEKRGKLAKSITIYPNMINTYMSTFIQQHLKAFTYKEVLQYEREGWGNLRMEMSLELLKKFSESIKSDDLQKWKGFNQWIAFEYQTMKLDSFMFYSQTIRSLESLQNLQIQNSQERERAFSEEYVFTTLYPQLYKKPSVIIGKALCVYGGQNYLNLKNENSQPQQIFNSYKQIIKQISL